MLENVLLGRDSDDDKSNSEDTDTGEENIDETYTEQELASIIQCLKTNEPKVLEMLKERKAHLLSSTHVQNQVSQQGLRIIYNLAIPIEKKSCNTLLILAAKSNKKLVLQELIDQGAELNIRNYADSTALHTAAREGHREIVNMLIKYGADQNIKNMYEGIPLHCAALSNNFETIEILINAGSSIHEVNEENKTPLDYMLPEYRLPIEKLWLENYWQSLQWASPLAPPPKTTAEPLTSFNDEEEKIPFNLNFG